MFIIGDSELHIKWLNCEKNKTIDKAKLQDKLNYEWI